MGILAERIKELRLDNKLKQTEVAEILGVSISTYCNYEYGQREPGASAISKLAQLYHVSADYLLGINEPYPEEKTNIILASNSPAAESCWGRWA